MGRLRTILEQLMKILYIDKMCMFVFQINLLGIKLAADAIGPKNVVYHFTRSCNECGLCSQAAKNPFFMELEEAQRGMEMLKKMGLEKIKISGGDPFLVTRGWHLGEIVKYCKETLKLQCVSVVSNGSLITEQWFQDYGKYLDIIIIPCDSFCEATYKGNGPRQRHTNHFEQLCKLKDWCTEYNVLFELNTVLKTYNVDENMVKELQHLNPIRWNVFQCLFLSGGLAAERLTEADYISNEMFQKFIDIHSSVKCLVPISKNELESKYTILDEYMRFLDYSSGNKETSKSILDVGVENALKFSSFDEVKFKKRGGMYKWSLQANQYSW